MSNLSGVDTPLGLDGLVLALEAARATGQSRPASTFAIPVDLAAAYRTQAARWTSRQVPGWKVGHMPSGQSIFAPLDPVRRHDTDLCPWRTGLGLEIEIAFVLSRDLPPKSGEAYDAEEIAASIATAHLGVEVIGSRIAEGGAAPFPLFLADGLANDGYILGPQVDDWSGTGPLRVTTGGTSLFDGPARHPQVDPLAPLIARANSQTGGWGDLRAGQIVTTGSLCGVLWCTEPSDVHIAFGSTAMTVRFRG